MLPIAEMVKCSKRLGSTCFSYGIEDHIKTYNHIKIKIKFGVHCPF